MNRVALLLLLFCAGCGLLAPRPRSESGGGGSRGGTQQQSTQPAAKGAARFELDPRYRPLVAIVERASLPFMSDTAATTISPEVFVVDLDGWLKKHPPGSSLFESVIRHEQVHAQRQEAYPGGVDPWVDRYLQDTAFMWDEEQRGWFEEIKYLRYGNLQIQPEGLARSLSRYRNLKGSMVSYEVALAWVQDVLNNRWQPTR